MLPHRLRNSAVDVPGKLARHFICARCASAVRHSLNTFVDATALTSLFASTSRRYAYAGLYSRRTYATSSALSPPETSLVDDRTRRHIEQDLERSVDIRTYLRLWLRKQSKHLDPVLQSNENGILSTVDTMGSMFGDAAIFQDKRPEILDLGRSIDLESDPSPFLRPGDLVHLQHQGSFSQGQLAVYLRTVNEQQQFYTVRGKWRIARPAEVAFIPDHRFPSELLEPILPYLPGSAIIKGPLPQQSMEGGVPRHIGAGLLSLILEFETAASTIYAENFSTFQNIHEILAKEDEAILLTFKEFAAHLLKRDPDTLTAAERYAVHLAADWNSTYIIANQDLSVVESYTIRSKAQARLISRVIGWVRDYQFLKGSPETMKSSSTSRHNPIRRFVKKAQRIITQSRNFRKPTQSFCLSPKIESIETLEGSVNEQENASSASVEPFSTSDRDIIDFLKLWVLPPLNRRDYTFRSTGSLILSHIKMYENFNLNEATAYLALQELSVLAPWENVHVLHEQVALPGHGIAPISDAIVDECNKFCESPKRDTLVDSMEDFRKDWGEMPVFCVDSASAAEIDDGFSLESIPESIDTFWIHIHVANPSAFIPHDHLLAKGAAHFKRSFYAPERVYPMFPPSLTHERFSLGPQKPTITFSAMINLQGEILDVKISHGRINNVIYITPDRLRKLFGIDMDNRPSISLEVGGTPSLPARPELQDHITKEHRSILETMEKLLASRQARRMEKGAIEFISNYPSVPLVSGDGESIRSYTGNILGNHNQQDPKIRIRGRMEQYDGSLEATKVDLVSHAMLLGGEIAAQWCKDRDIPVIFAAASYRPDNIITPNRDESAPGMSPYSQLPRAFASSKPVPHTTLGMDQYSKCTSPLRRYSDLIVHWQVEAAMRHNSEKNRVEEPKEAAPNAQSFLPFSREDIKAIIRRSNWQNRIVERAQTSSREFWVLQALFRAYYFEEAELPKAFQCIIVNQLPESSSLTVTPGDVQYTATLLPFRVRCVVTADKTQPAFRPGDSVEGEISKINLYAVFLEIRATQLIHRPNKEQATVPLGFIPRSA